MQNIVVWIIVALAALYLVWRYSRTLSGKGQGCDCGLSSCKSCSSPEDDRICGFPKPAQKTDKK